MTKFKNMVILLGLGVILVAPSSLMATSTLSGVNTTTVTEEKVVGPVEVKPVSKEVITSFSIDKLDEDLLTGKSYQLKTSLNLEDLDSEIVWKSLNANATVNQEGVMIIKNKGDIKITATVFNGEKNIVATFTGKSSYSKDWFRLAQSTINIKNSVKGKVIVKFDSNIDAKSVFKNVNIATDEAGNNTLGGITIYVDGSSLIISSDKGWNIVESNELYLCIDKDLKDSKGVALNNRVKFKIVKS